MNQKVKYIVTGMFICAAISFAGVSCMKMLADRDTKYVDLSNIDLVQTKPPKDGDTTAVIKTTEGDMSFVLYPDKAPETVKHFTQLAESGYYDDTFVFQSEPGVYFSAGSPNRTGDLNEDDPVGTEEWPQELDSDLWTFKGALCSLDTGKEEGWWKRLTGSARTMNGSRFCVMGSVDFTEDFKKELLESNDDKTLANAFIKYGGVPAKAQKMTVFGQIYDGMDVADKLMNLETRDTAEGMKIPVDDVKIKTAEIGTYKSKGVTSPTEGAVTETVSKTSKKE